MKAKTVMREFITAASLAIFLASVSFWSVGLLGINGIIGAGIFLTPGAVPKLPPVPILSRRLEELVDFFSSSLFSFLLRGGNPPFYANL